MVQTLQTPELQVTGPSFETALLACQVSSLDQAIARALESARTSTCQHGITAPETAVAWDIVEELMVARARRYPQRSLTPFEQYCLDYPDAPESRMYEI